MEAMMYRNRQLEEELLARMDGAEQRSPLPPPAKGRLETEKRCIFQNGYGTMLAVAARLAEFSAEQGYPASFRGFTGNLLLARLLGFSAIDPLELGLRWEGCLGLSGDRAPVFTLNLAEEVLDGAWRFLRELLPECTVREPEPWRALIIPGKAGIRDLSRTCFTITLCPHALMSRAGAEQRRIGRTPRRQDVLSPDLINLAWDGAAEGIPVLGDLEGLQDLCRRLRPQTLPELARLIGLCLAPQLLFQLRSGANPETLIGAREDLFDLCVRHGVSENDAHRIMQAVGQGGFGRLTERLQGLCRRALPNAALRTMEAIDYLYPRGQCAEYGFWALTLLWYRTQT